MDKVSVIFPLYGNVNIERPRISLESIRNQKGVNIEIIVSEVSEKQVGKRNLGDYLTKYVTVHPSEENKVGIFRPGEIRNHAIRESTGEYVYATDGDVVFTNQHYIKELVELSKLKGEVALCCPPMRRLPLECFEEFKEIIQINGLRESLKIIDTSKEYIATTPQSNIGMKVINYNDGNGDRKTVLYTDTDWVEYKSTPENIGQEPRFSTITTHGGGTLLKKNWLNDIGGYSREYINWGQDDEDIQWKLSRTIGIDKIPEEERFEVLHLDHPRGYFRRDQWRKNLEVQNLRGKSDFKEIVLIDKFNLEGINGK